MKIKFEVEDKKSLKILIDRLLSFPDDKKYQVIIDDSWVDPNEEIRLSYE